MFSDDDSINEWTLDEIDLDKPLVDLHSIVDDRSSLVDAAFEYLNKDELRKIFNHHSKSEVSLFWMFLLLLFIYNR